MRGWNNYPVESKSTQLGSRLAAIDQQSPHLADDDCVLRPGVLPDDWIVGRVQADIEYVRGLMAVADDPLRQRWRKLSVYQELQDRCRTVWSACRAA